MAKRAPAVLAALIILAVLPAAARAQAPPPVPLAVAVSGGGSATLSGAVEDECAGECDYEVPYEEVACPPPDEASTCYSPATVTIAPVTPPQRVFAGFGGDCAGAGPCTLTLDAAKSVTATFENPAPSVVLAIAPVVRGPVTLAPSLSEDVVSVELFVDGTITGSPVDTTALPDGPHTFTARAFDAEGLSGEASVAATVDNSPPAIAFVGGVAEGATVAAGAEPTITFEVGDVWSDVAAVRCFIDNAALPDCSSGSATLSDLGLGAHSFRVQATDALGNLAIATRAFTVVEPPPTVNPPSGGQPLDTVAPQTSIIRGPGNGSATMETNLVFGFSASESGATFECRLMLLPTEDPEPFGPCSAPREDAVALTPGLWLFEVRAVDASGNADGSPAQRIILVQPAQGTPRQDEPTQTTTTTTPVIETELLFLRLANFWQKDGRSTRATELQLIGAPRGTRVTMECDGRRCPYERRTIRRRSSTVNLIRGLKGKSLRAGTRLTVRMSIPRYGTYMVRFTMRARGFPTRRDYCPTDSGRRFKRCG